MYFHCVLTIHESTACHRLPCPHKLKPYIHRKVPVNHTGNFFFCINYLSFQDPLIKKDINIDSVPLYNINIEVTEISRDSFTQVLRYTRNTSQFLLDGAAVL